MLTRLLSFAFVGVFAAVAQAQLPSERFSPINYFGRYHGFGYSDGYHACKGVRCNSWSLWKPWESMSKPWESMSSLYGSPSPSTSNRAARIQATANLPMVSQEYYAAPIDNQSIGFPSEPMQNAQPQLNIPSEPLNGAQLLPASQDSYDSDPPAPTQTQPSPSVGGFRALPPLGK